MPAAADYTILWWQYGWLQHALLKPAVLCLQTGRYGLALDVETLKLLRFGRLLSVEPYEMAARERPDFLESLPRGQFELAVVVGDKRYICRQAAADQKDWLNFPVRVIESGRFLQRCDFLQLSFAADDGQKLEAEGRLEIVAWPDQLNFILEVTPKSDLENASVSIVLTNNDLTFKQALVPELMPSGKTRKISLSCSFLGTQASPPDVAITVTDKAPPQTSCTVEFDAARGWHRIALPKWRWSVNEQPDRLDRFKVRIRNASPAKRIVRLLFDAEESIPGITGFTPMLRDAEGFPTGIPVQLSKNWHRQEKRRLLYEGPWFHGFTLLQMPSETELECEFAITWAKWGGIPAASHAQLCLVGWGWNQIWDQSAIGSWGESICYEPDAVQQRCRIDDVRPLMVWGMGGDRIQWSWTHNVGGGDFLVYYNERGDYVPLVGMKTAYEAHGPNLTSVTYAGVTSDEHIRAVLNVSLPRCDDLNRVYHRFRYEVLKPTPFKRLAFYQVGADNYHWHQYNSMARGSESGLIEEFKPERGGETYHRSAIPCPGSVPWFSLHDSIPQDNRKPIKGAWANRGLVLRSWKARLGGNEAPPFAAVFGTVAGGIPSANLELSVPPELSQLVPGDFVEALVELLIIPMSADDYYGPNENFRSSLRGEANTWKPVFRQATANHLNLHVLKGELLRTYPPLLKVDSTGAAEVEIIGGIGYVPVSFERLTDYRNPQLQIQTGSEMRVVDQSVHGRDFWQTDYNPAAGQWRITYNIPLDIPSRSQPIRVNFKQ